jgi:DNA-binding PadR family transcriptional regulator
MPPPQGELTATKAILGLFIAEPSTTQNIKIRLRREFPTAGWSRSIVNKTVPALVRQGLIVMVSEGSKPSEHFYEATVKGVDEFERWLAETPAAPAPLRDSFLIWLANSTEEALPRMLSIARKQEEAADVELQRARQRLNHERDLGSLDPADWNGRVQYTVLSLMALTWNFRVECAKSVRLNLTQGHNRHMRLPDDNDA